MKKRLIPTFILLAYILILIKVMIFKDVPTIHVGQLMLNFGGTTSGNSANFIPFATILPYLFGFKGLIIAGINLIGNIALLVPIGFLAPLVFPNMTWKKSLTLGVVAGLVIEVMQVILNVGIFDIDDVILNALGAMIGYWAYVFLTKWIREKNYKNIIISAIIFLALCVAAFQVVNPRSGPQVNHEDDAHADLCGGTGGIGEIASVGTNTITVTRKDGQSLTVTLTDQTAIITSEGPISQSDLKTGERVTLVGDATSDNHFSADAVFVCR